MIDWKHGNIKEVARSFHEKYNISNITYETTPNSVVFLCDGFFLAFFKYRCKN